MSKGKNAQKRLVLLDVHAIIHRAYHALPEFSSSKGEPTGAIYGLATMLFKIITELKPDYIVACFDLPKKTFRHEAYDNYKAGRAKTDDALVAQIIRSRDFFKAFSIPMYECEGFEADDLLGTIAEHLKNNHKDVDVIIASGDMDTLQLVDDEKVRVYTLKKGINDTILYDEDKVKERFGFLPKYLPDYKGLRGDPSDNIIGIKGIGEKTATTLIVEYGTIEKMYEAMKKSDTVVRKLGITERIFNLLKDGEEEALFSKTLATIRRDAPIKFELPKMSWRDTVIKDDVAEFFRYMEFKSLQTRFVNILDGNENKKASTKVGAPIEVREEIIDPNISRDKLTKAKIALWLLNSEKTDPNMDDITHYKGSSSFDEAFTKLERDIEKENLTYVYKDIELPIIHIIAGMEERGIKVDLEYLKKLSKDYHTELTKIEKSIWKMAGREFNINSPKQLGEVLFDELKIQEMGDKGARTKMKKTAGGARSTRESELEKLKGEHPIIDEILKYRELQKLLSTYIDTIPEQVSSDGRLHAKFIQTGSSTGRFSSQNPNLQNIPIKTELGKNIRKSFVAESGYVLASFDYSQIELRVAALMSQDPYFIEVFKEGKDIHSAVAMKVFGVKESDVTYDMRRRAKIINFGMLYGMGVNALRQNIGTDRKEAQIFYDNYFAQFPSIVAYLDSIKKFAKDHGYTETLFGRKRYFSGIRSPIPFIKAMAERMAINAPIQGTATADIIKISMRRVEDDLKKAGILDDVRLVLQVHDELVYEIKEDKVKQAMKIVETAMKHVIPSEFLANLESVPLEVSSSSGPTWGDLK
ncbi:MAG: DNA polymerase [Patescibacteria group bacterium]